MMVFINLIKKRGQTSTEYLIVLGFLIFVVISTFSFAIFYSSNLKDQMRMKQLESFAKKITSSAEIVFYSGSPSKTTFNAYIPPGVKNITIYEKEIFFIIKTESGDNHVSFKSDVKLLGTIDSNSGLKRFRLTAIEDGVLIEVV